MEFVALLRVLWRHRIAVAIGGVVAIGLAFLATHGRTTRTGIASLRVLIDTPTSELLNASPAGGPTLGWRTQLLAGGIAADATTARVAAAIGTSPDKLIINTPSQSIAPVPLSLPVVALDAAAGSASTKPFEVAVEAASPLPILRIDTRAPTRRQAARLATVAAQAIKDAARARGNAAGFPDLSAQDLTVQNVGPVKSREIVNGPRRMKAVIAAFLAFVLWCSGVMAMAAFARARRRSPLDPQRPDRRQKKQIAHDVG